MHRLLAVFSGWGLTLPLTEGPPVSDLVVVGVRVCAVCGVGEAQPLCSSLDESLGVRLPGLQACGFFSVCFLLIVRKCTALEM